MTEKSAVAVPVLSSLILYYHGNFKNCRGNQKGLLHIQDDVQKTQNRRAISWKLGKSFLPIRMIRWKDVTWKFVTFPMTILSQKIRIMKVDIRPVILQSSLEILFASLKISLIGNHHSYSCPQLSSLYLLVADCKGHVYLSIHLQCLAKTSIYVTYSICIKLEYIERKPSAYPKIWKT